MCHRIVFILCLLLAALRVEAYELGSMSCDDIGDFAREAWLSRQRGVTREQALAALDTRQFNASVEKENLTAVIRIVYSSIGEAWDEEGAYGVLRNECLTHSR